MRADVTQVGPVCKSQRQHGAPFGETMVDQSLANFKSVGSRPTTLNNDVGGCIAAEGVMNGHGSTVKKENYSALCLWDQDGCC